MNLLGDKISKLTKTSQDIISVFTSTINKLTAVNETIIEETEIKKEEVISLNQEIEVLDRLMISNDKIISKVKQIIE